MEGRGDAEGGAAAPDGRVCTRVFSQRHLGVYFESSQYCAAGAADHSEAGLRVCKVEGEAARRGVRAGWRLVSIQKGKGLNMNIDIKAKSPKAVSAILTIAARPVQLTFDTKPHRSGGDDGPNGAPEAGAAGPRNAAAPTDDDGPPAVLEPPGHRPLANRRAIKFDAESLWPEEATASGSFGAAGGAGAPLRAGQGAGGDTHLLQVVLQVEAPAATPTGAASAAAAPAEEGDPIGKLLRDRVKEVIETHAIRLRSGRYFFGWMLQPLAAREDMLRVLSADFPAVSSNAIQKAVVRALYVRRRDWRGKGPSAYTGAMRAADEREEEMQRERLQKAAAPGAQGAPAAAPMPNAHADAGTQGTAGAAEADTEQTAAAPMEGRSTADATRRDEQQKPRWLANDEMLKRPLFPETTPTPGGRAPKENGSSSRCAVVGGSAAAQPLPAGPADGCPAARIPTDAPAVPTGRSGAEVADRLPPEPSVGEGARCDAANERRRGDARGEARPDGALAVVRRDEDDGERSPAPRALAEDEDEARAFLGKRRRDEQCTLGAPNACAYASGADPESGRLTRMMRRIETLERGMERRDQVTMAFMAHVFDTAAGVLSEEAELVAGPAPGADGPSMDGVLVELFHTYFGTLGDFLISAYSTEAEDFDVCGVLLSEFVHTLIADFMTRGSRASGLQRLADAHRAGPPAVVAGPTGPGEGDRGGAAGRGRPYSPDELIFDPAALDVSWDDIERFARACEEQDGDWCDLCDYLEGPDGDRTAAPAAEAPLHTAIGAPAEDRPHEGGTGVPLCAAPGGAPPPPRGGHARLARVHAVQARAIRDLLSTLAGSHAVPEFAFHIFSICLRHLEALQDSFEAGDGAPLGAGPLVDLGASAWLLQVYEVSAISISGILRCKHRVDRPLSERIVALFREHVLLYKRMSRNLDEAYFLHYINAHQRITAIILTADQ